LRTWQASLGLVEFLASNPAILSGKRVELGAGAGLLGLMCRMMGASQVLLTDVDENVLDRIHANIQLNYNRSGLLDNVHATKLDWEDESNWPSSLSNENSIDVILGADIVYSPDLVAPLCKTLARLLALNECSCYLSLTRRQESTFTLLLETLASMNMSCRQIDTELGWYFYEEGSESIVLLHITLVRSNVLPMPTVTVSR
jgi:protein-lysine N-methyltransferase EEF2KMT